MRVARPWVARQADEGTAALAHRAPMERHAARVQTGEVGQDPIRLIGQASQRVEHSGAAAEFLRALADRVAERGVWADLEERVLIAPDEGRNRRSEENGLPDILPPVGAVEPLVRRHAARYRGDER